MLISSQATCFHNSFLSSPIRKLNIRNIYLRSRFQQLSIPTENQPNDENATNALQTSVSSSASCATSPLDEHRSVSPSENQLISPPSLSKFTPVRFRSEFRSRNKELEDLQKSIIRKLNSIWIDRSLKSNTDLEIITEKCETKPSLSPIDEHILLNAKVMVPSDDHSGNDYQRLKLKRLTRNKLIDGNLYEYKYELIHDCNSIVEIKLLVSLIQRLTKYTFLNSTDRIKHFLKSRIIYTHEGQQLLRKNKSLTYCLIDFFMRNGSLSNIAIVEDIIKIVGDWDTFSLNIYLKHSLSFCTDPFLKLRLVESTINKFIQNDIYPNRTTLYIIYMNIDKAGLNSFDLQNLKYAMQDFFFEKNLLNGAEFTTILFEDLYNSWLLIDNEKQRFLKKKKGSYRRILTSDSIRTMNLIPKFKSLEQLEVDNRYTTKCLRKVFLNSKFKSANSFKVLLFAHLEENWKRSWDMAISNYYFLRDTTSQSLTESIKATSLKRYPELRFTNLGKLFFRDRRYLVNCLQKPIGYRLVTYLSSQANWQLLVRTLNELNSLTAPASTDKYENGVAWNTFYKSLKDLLDTDLDKTLLDPMCYLVLLKYLMNNALNTTLGPYKRWDRLFRKSQRKIDAIYHTSFSKLNTSCTSLDSEKMGNVYVWLEKVRLVRAKRSINRSHQLYGAIFDTTECRDVSDEISEVTGNEKIAKSYSDPDSLPNSNLISPDLSVITPFESLLFKSLSSLKVLDSKEKVETERKMFSSFWDSKRINSIDVLNNYHLGFINKSYKFGKIRWEQNITGVYDSMIDPEIPGITKSDVETDTLKMEAIARINNIVQDNLTVFLDNSKKHTALELVVSLKRPDGIYKKIDPESSLNNVLPNDWLYMVIDKCHNDWLIQQFTKKLHSIT